jgi:oligopeptide/dipeptide ABC transporter ATP-binding protein
MAAPRDVLLAVEDLKVHFPTEHGVVRAVEGVTFAIREGETLAVVGESGSGKSVTSLAIMGLLPRGRATIPEGTIRFEGQSLLDLPERERRRLRGNRMTMIFQEPMTSLNPVYAVGWQIAEVMVAHKGIGWRRAKARAVELLDLVGIPEPAARAKSYPHQLSGGMRQRAMIAMALACDPKLLIADEPTTALDVTIQAQILDLMRRLQSETGMAILFITHDLAVVAEMADQVVVMYAGRAVEQADVISLFEAPLMPYTVGLLRSIPHWDYGGTGSRSRRLQVIPGNVPNPLALPGGCDFHPRCPHRQPVCTAAIPALEDSGGGHRVRCARWRELRRAEPELRIGAGAAR